MADTKYAKLVGSGVLSAPDVLYALPDHGRSGPFGSTGILLGDVNANGTTDGGENTLFVPLAAAVQLINSSATANDTRQILLRHALAAQLNINNHDIAPGGTIAGAGLISEAVQWLKGQGPFIYQDRSSGKVDFVGSAGVVDTGTSGLIDYNTNNAAFTSAQLTSRTDAWNAKVGLGLSPADFRVSGEDMKNALQAFNQNQLVTSKDGMLIGWNSNGTMTDIHDNSTGSMWTVLRHAGVVT